MDKRAQVYEKIREIHEREQTLALSLGRGGHAIAVHFEHGLISAVSGNNPQCRLGKYLKETAGVDEAEINQLLRESRRHGWSIGQAAVKKGLIDAETLLELLHEQAVQILLPAFKEDYEIRSVEKSLVERYLPARMSPQHMMLLIARKSATPFALKDGRLVVMRASPEIARLPWFPEELAVMGMLKNPRGFDELVSTTGLDELSLRRILSVFDRLGLIELAEAPTETTTAVVKREGFPFDALVPELPTTGVSWELEAFLHENSFASEQFKALKVRIANAPGERPFRVITVTSPDRGAGKSLLSANLAMSFSKDPERRTILVDCDLRKPSLHTLTGASLAPGLVEYLQDDRLQSFCYMRRLDTLFLMTAGGWASNPIELLSLDKMRAFIESLRAEFHTVILDAPPLAPVSDVEVLAGLSDGLILTIRSGKTSYASIERALRNLDQSKLIGTVLNDVPPLMFNTQYDAGCYGSIPYGTRPVGKGVAGRRKDYLDG